MFKAHAPNLNQQLLNSLLEHATPIETDTSDPLHRSTFILSWDGQNSLKVKAYQNSSTDWVVTDMTLRKLR